MIKKRATIITALIISMLYISVSAQNSEVVREPRSEMDALRMLIDKPVATYQDMADIIIVSRGEFSQYNNFSARRQRISELGVFTFDKVSDPLNEPLRRGDLSVALHNSYDLEQGLMYMVTSMGRYAHRDMQNLRIMDRRFSEMDNISGGILIAVLDRADRAQQVKRDWAKPVGGAEIEEQETKVE